MEHKKSMFPYVEPTAKTADKIETNQRLIDEDFIDLQTKFDEVNDVVAEQKKIIIIRNNRECHRRR